jgi:hypothetical protein
MVDHAMSTATFEADFFRDPDAGTVSEKRPDEILPLRNRCLKSFDTAYGRPFSTTSLAFSLLSTKCPRTREAAVRAAAAALLVEEL